MPIDRNYKGLAVKLPLSYDDRFGPYEMHTRAATAIKQNFKNLVLTNPGERIMNSDFGAGVRRLLFENKTDEVIENVIESIYTQTAKYLPFVQVLQVEPTFIENTLLIKISYYVPDLGVQDQLNLNIDTQSIG
jgi:phage baseplate assembly protein W|tara:strand:+ start:56 stop:454 length:399 start_codon:yes stop_codon:yes gene_type:complete